MTFSHRSSAASVVLVLGLALTGCTSATTPTEVPSSSSSTSASSGTSAAPADTITIDITIAGGQVTPNGQKIDARVGQRVVENITSDVDEEVHAHTGGDGYELEVKAGTPATGGFDLTTPGSFEIETHHSGKIIAILNVR
ncbi:hypothetical protein [uncultured Friedmanniella sp.]|uniref:hypothetical protein n=1 Tax=uncultured Friedmanniella sp. TaxID=335381 RepID=UPI0035CB6E99